MNLISIIDYSGTLVFALSGVVAGVDRKFDLFGVFILGFVTATGGGTLRDLMIGSTPVGWMQNEIYTFLVAAAIPIVFILNGPLRRMRRGFFIFDTVGIGLYSVVGVEKTLGLGLSPLIAVMMGVVSAVFGGVIRDVLANRTPLIFREEIYAMACLGGAACYYCALQFLNRELSMVIAIAIVILLRFLAIRYRWSLPFNPILWRRRS